MTEVSFVEQKLLSFNLKKIKFQFKYFNINFQCVVKVSVPLYFISQCNLMLFLFLYA